MGLLLLPYAAAALILIGGIALSILLMLDLRTIARRVGHASIAEHCTIVGVGMAGTLVLIPVVIAIASISSERFLSYSTTWLLIATLISTSGALFAFLVDVPHAPLRRFVPQSREAMSQLVGRGRPRGKSRVIQDSAFEAFN